MTSSEAINQNFIPYPYNFPSITFVVDTNIHQHQHEYVEHECEKLSTCCGADENEYVDNFCSACNEWAEFECNECEDNNE